MSLNELKTLVGNVTKALYENEKLPVPILAVKARKAAEVHPTDQTIIAMANFLSQRAEGNQIFISRKELKSVYNKLYSPNNKFASLFADEIGPSEVKGAKYASRSEYEGTSIDVDYTRSADSLLSNALNAAFDKTATYKPYSSEIAVKAEKACVQELNRLGVPPRMISVFAGNSDILVCDAIYETPKGQSHVLVPIEIHSNNALLPTIFLSKAGFVDLSTEDLEEHISKTAGQSYHVDGNKVLKVLSAAKFGADEPTSKVALAAMKLKAQQETPSDYTAEGIVYQKVDEPMADVNTTYEQTEEVASFAQQLTSAKGSANYLFGEDMVKKAENTLKTRLAGFGYKQAQIAISNVQDNILVFAVNVDGTAGFQVPIKVNRNYVEDPKIIIASGAAHAFSRGMIGQILAENQVDARALAQASSLRGMKSGELVEQIRQAMTEDNYLKAEEALNVLKQEYGLEAHARGMSVYMSGLKKEASAQPEESKCSMVVQANYSKYPLCGHTGLPVHEVYQDAHGDCHPLYRKGMKDDEEGGAFMANKVFL